MALYLNGFFLLIGLNFVFCQTEQTKLEQLVELQGTKDFINLDAGLFKKFVQGQSRSYIIVVYFTTFLYESQCPGCQVINPIFLSSAYSYKASDADKAMELDEEKLKPVFFGVVEYSQLNIPIFQKFQFQNIPNIFVSTKSFSEDGPYYNIDRSKLLEYQDNKNYTIDSILNYINSKTGRKVEVKIRISDYVKEYGLYLTLILGIYYSLKNTIKHYKNPKFWWLMSMIVYIVCVGGVVYDIIHNVQMGELNPETSEFSLIAEGAREQYYIEGFLMSTLFALSASGLIGINLASSIEGKWLIRLVCLFCISIWVTCVLYTEFIYKQKAQWYLPTFEPPEGYMKGSIMKDQGNSF